MDGRGPQVRSYYYGAVLLPTPVEMERLMVQLRRYLCLTVLLCYKYRPLSFFIFYF